MNEYGPEERFVNDGRGKRIKDLRESQQIPIVTI